MPTFVNGEELEQPLIDRETRELRDRYRTQGSCEENPEQEEKIRKDGHANAIEKLLLLQQARARIAQVPMKEAKDRLNTLKRQHGGGAQFYKQYDLHPDNDDAICRNFQEQIRLEKLYEQITRDTGAPTEEECETYYGENPDLFKVPEQIRVSHFVRQPKPGTPSASVYSELLNIRESLVQGADFGEIVSRHSDCKDNGGDLGYISRGRMVDAFDRVVFEMQPGETSDVFQTEFGYHIARVFDRIPSRMLGYEEAREQIGLILTSHRKNARIGECVDQLLKEAEIEERDE